MPLELDTGLRAKVKSSHFTYLTNILYANVHVHVQRTNSGTQMTTEYKGKKVGSLLLYYDVTPLLRSFQFNLGDSSLIDHPLVNKQVLG